MNNDQTYNEITGALSSRICDTWPEFGFLAADWSDLSNNIKKVYNAYGESSRSIPHSVRIGYMDDTPEGMSLAKVDGTPELRIPLLFDWSAYRGLFLCSYDIDGDGDSASISIANQVASAMLLRLALHAERGRILIHKVDPLNKGKYMDHIPAQADAPKIVKKENLIQLLDKLNDQIANLPVAPLSWRCDSNEDTYTTDTLPLQIVYIANWNDLYDIHEDKHALSHVQKDIMEMLNSDVPARNGIYFFICGSKENAFKDFAKVLPTFAIDKCNNSDSGVGRGYRAQLFSHIEPENKNSKAKNLTERKFNCKFILPSEKELQTILKTHSNYLSGALNDTESESIWLGNSSKGIRATMGVTQQGSNQFFELGIGQGVNAYHALIGGATGSGKSVLLKEIICSLAERYSPSELRMLLLDYKEGTEFATFSKLPHVFALSIGSNAEFGLEALKEMKKECIEKRGELFKATGTSNIEEYRELCGNTICRYVLVADEFQVLLRDKKYGEEAKKILNHLVREGRSFGFHAILATQTLRDGALDGEAKNQFGCRIALKMAEDEIGYFLASENTLPATFDRKGQALVNYNLGRKESNIIFQSGNKNMPKKFRDTSEVLKCVDKLRQKAEADHCLPTDVYIYNSDGFAEMPISSINTSSGIILGLRNDMRGTPLIFKERQLSGKILILGDNKEKQKNLLNSLALQIGMLYNEQVNIQTPADYLDYPMDRQVTILNVPEGDFDLEDAIAEWIEEGTEKKDAAIPHNSLEMPTYTALSGMEADFAKLQQEMQTNYAAMGAEATAPSRNRRNRDTRCLIVSICTAADIKLIEAGGLKASDFRTIIYLNNETFNQMPGYYENTPLGDAAALLESRGAISKIRLIKINHL